jgi:hypothetical protein
MLVLLTIFLSTFCKMLQHFSEMWEQHFLFVFNLQSRACKGGAGGRGWRATHGRGLSAGRRRTGREEGVRR